MGTETQNDCTERIRQAHWAQRRSADAVSDRQARVAAAERALAEARRQLRVAELELQAATWTVDAAAGAGLEDSS
jgi:hypothetical protein